MRSERSLSYDLAVISARDAFVDTAAFSRERARPLAPDDRRDAILDAVVPLLREKGRDVSSRQLAEAAGIAEGTLFRAFGDKESLIAAAIERIFDPTPLWIALESIDADTGLDQKLTEVMRVLHAHFRAVVSAVVALGLRERPPARPEHLERRLAAILADLLAPDLDRLAVPVETVAEYVRLVAFASSLPMAPDLGDDVLSGLIARGILRHEKRN